MGVLRRMTIASQLALAAVVAVACLLVLAYTSREAVGNLSRSADSLVSRALPISECLSKVELGLWVAGAGSRTLQNRRLFSREKDRLQAYGDIDRGEKLTGDALTLCEPLLASGETAANWSDARKAAEQWRVAAERVRRLSKDKEALVATGVPLDDERITKLDEEGLEALVTQKDSGRFVLTRIHPIAESISKEVATTSKNLVELKEGSRRIIDWSASLALLFVVTGTVAVALGMRQLRCRAIDGGRSRGEAL
jgi:hypothetical protein